MPYEDGETSEGRGVGEGLEKKMKRKRKKKKKEGTKMRRKEEKGGKGRRKGNLITRRRFRGFSEKTNTFFFIIMAVQTKIISFPNILMISEVV